MTFGVILDNESTLETPPKAHFYIPTTATDKSSHVYVLDLAQLGQVPPDVTPILAPDLLDLVQWDANKRPTPDTKEAGESALLSLDSNDPLLPWLERCTSIMVTVTLKPCPRLWEALKRLENHTFLLACALEETLLSLWLDRYKSVSYSAVVLLSDRPDVCAQAHQLLAKPLPKLVLPSHIALLHPFEFWDKLARPHIEPHTDFLIDPLQPLSTYLDLEVYETFEKDTQKYKQYARAVRLAISDLQSVEQLKVLVIGPGRGPLLRMVKGACRDTRTGPSPTQYSIVAVERNHKCMPHLAQLRDEHVTLVHGDVRDLQDLNKYHLVVLELLGLFACNEAFPEILSVFRNTKTVFIPLQISSLVQPVYSALANTEPRPYLCRPSAVFAIEQPKEVFSYEYPGVTTLLWDSNLRFEGSPDESANALLGYFEAVLYGPYKISICPEAPAHERCESWFPFLMPFPETQFPLLVTVSRHSLSFVSYLWLVNGVLYENDYRVSLHQTTAKKTPEIESSGSSSKSTQLVTADLGAFQLV